jgi:hypothetical protein
VPRTVYPIIALITASIALAACGKAGSGNNTVPLLVATGVTKAINVPSISIQLCAPGGTNCQTIDDIQIDTGSIGMRVLSSVIDPALLAALPTTTANGAQLAECYVYADGYVFGTIRSADLSLGEEAASSIPFQVIGDLVNVPDDCASAGAAEDTPATFGANGIIGVGLSNIDCGADCTDGQSQNPRYYACTDGACADGTAPTAQQVPNPVAKLPQDNNGVVIELPTISDSGATDPQGTLTFGIGTQPNNHVSGEKVYKAMFAGIGVVSTTFSGQSYPYSFFDTGSTDLSFASSLPACTDATEFYCPASTQHLSATILDADGNQGSVSFTVASADALFMNTKATAFDDLADVGFSAGPGQPNIFDWGLPFFFGRRVFAAMDGASTSSGDGPYYAF